MSDYLRPSFRTNSIVCQRWWNESTTEIYDAIAYRSLNFSITELGESFGNTTGYSGARKEKAKVVGAVFNKYVITGEFDLVKIIESNPGVQTSGLLGLLGSLPEIPPKVALALAKSVSIDPRMALSKKQGFMYLPVAAILAKDENRMVLRNLLNNPMTPEHIRAMVALSI